MTSARSFVQSSIVVGFALVPVSFDACFESVFFRAFRRWMSSMAWDGAILGDH